MKKCCFCGKEFKGFGNSTWPIYPDAIHCEEGKPNGEQMRCCDECNEKVIEERLVKAFEENWTFNHIRYLF